MRKEMSEERYQEELLLTFFFIAVISGIIVGLINITSQRDKELLKWLDSSNRSDEPR